MYEHMNNTCLYTVDHNNYIKDGTLLQKTEVATFARPTKHKFSHDRIQRGPCLIEYLRDLLFRIFIYTPMCNNMSQ